MYQFFVSVQLYWCLFGNKLLINLCALWGGLAVEYVLNKGNDNLNEKCGKCHSFYSLQSKISPVLASAPLSSN